MQKSAVINDIRGATTLSVLGGVLVPISLVFVLFSTPRSRRQPIFWIQCLALALAMSEAAIEVASYHIDIETNGVHPPLESNLANARETLKWIIPWITDCALLFKILCFYPRTLFSRKKQLSMIAFPTLIKVPRITVIIINLVIMYRALDRGQTSWPDGLKFQVAEIAMQVADNTYCSSILLYKSWKFFNVTSGHTSRTARAQRRARHILESVTMSFVPALGIQIAFLVVQAIPGNNPTKLVEAQGYLFIFNVFFSLIFSILATSWSSICNVAEWNRTTSARSGHKNLLLSGGGGSGGSGGINKRSGGGSGDTAMERELPEHRTLLHYLTTSDEMEELSSMSEDGGSSSDGGMIRRDLRDPMQQLEKGGMHSTESLRSNANVTTLGPYNIRRKAPPASTHDIGGVVIQQERQRAMSPHSHYQVGNIAPNTTHNARMRQARVAHLENGAKTESDVPPFRSPQIPPFTFQERDGETTIDTSDYEDDKQSRTSSAARTQVD